MRIRYRIFLLLLMSSLCKFCFPQKQEQSYAVLAAIVNHKNPPQKLVLTLADFKSNFHDFNEILTKEFLDRHIKRVLPDVPEFLSDSDYKFMKEQFNNLKNEKTLNQTLLKKYKIDFIKSPDKGQDCETSLINKATLPIYSKDFKRAIVYLENICAGQANGSIYILQQAENEKWNIALSIVIWQE